MVVVVYRGLNTGGTSGGGGECVVGRALLF